MKIKHLILHTNRLSEQKHFYQDILGCDKQEDSENAFSVQIGWTTFEFRASAEAHLYHYCFLIPSNKLEEALEWIEAKVDIIDTGSNEKITFFDTWNAHSFYFYDGAGNIAECIVRHDLDNTSTSAFQLSDLLCVNEIGMPTENIEFTVNVLQNAFGLPLWRGDLERFGASGSEEGLFLLPNIHKKEIWFPTDIKITRAPFSIIFENDGHSYSFDYINGKIVDVKTIQ